MLARSGREAEAPRSSVRSGWYSKVLLAAMLNMGVCRWDYIALASPRAHHLGKTEAVYPVSSDLGLILYRECCLSTGDMLQAALGKKLSFS